MALIPMIECYERTETSLADGSSVTGIGRSMVSGILMVD